ncbi:MAG: DUF2933 domain-containing protein [Parvibaculum sp.]|nr:DUF2933 domain-containing protein [Parvibaculum sp.]
MAWLAENWIWVLIGVVFIGLHLFGHGGHRGHGGDEGHSGRGKSGDKTKTNQSGQHRH